MTVDPVEALRQATREAREVLKDLRVEHRALQDTRKRIEQTHTAARDMIAEWEQSISDRVQASVRASVGRELAVLTSETAEAVRVAQARVYERFDKLGREILDVLGGEDSINSLRDSLHRVKRGELTSVPTVTVSPIALKRNGAKPAPDGLR